MGRGPHTVLVRALLRHAGVGSTRGRDPRGSRSSRIPPPPRVAVPSGGAGRPLGSGGGEGRSCGSLAGGVRGGGVVGPPPRLPRRASACLLLPPACPPGVYSCREGCRTGAGVGRGPVGRRRVSAAGGGGGGPPALVCAPVFPGPASDKAALFAQSWVSPVRRRPAAGRACGRLPRPWCPRTPGAAASSGGGVGPLFLRSASVRSGWA